MTACTQHTDQLIDYALGVLASDAARRVEEHIETCHACATVVDELNHKRTELDRALAELVQAEPPAGFHSRVVQKAGQPYPASLPVRILWKALPVAAALAFAAVLFYQWGRPDPLFEFASRAAAWRSPTDSLLRLPGDDMLSARFIIGDFYFEFDATAFDEAAGQEEEN